VLALPGRAGRLYARFGLGKGQVESQVGLVRERFFTPRLKVKSYDELNAWLVDKCLAWAKSHAHPEQSERTIWEVFEEERPKLIEYRTRFDGFHSVPASVSKLCLVRFDNNHYSVNASAVGRAVEIQAYADRVVIRRDGQIVAEHPRKFGRGETAYDPWRYVPVLARKPGALRNGAPFKDWVLPAALDRVRRARRRVAVIDLSHLAWLAMAERPQFVTARASVCIPLRIVRELVLAEEAIADRRAALGSGHISLEAAVDRLEIKRSAIFRVWVASARREARWGPEEAAVEERLEGARQDRSPFLQAGQLLRIFGQAAQEGGDGRKRPGGGFSFGVRARDADRRLPCVPGAGGDRRQEQRAAGDRLAVEAGIGETDEDVPPVVKQPKQPGREPATGKIVRRVAAPTPLVLHLVENILDIPSTMPLIN
jgi:Mu transposase, C-terminal domain